MTETALAISDEEAAIIAAKRRPLGGAVILIGEAGAVTGGAMRSALREAGAANVLWRRSMAGVEAALEDGGVACAQIDVRLPGGDIIDLARRIRFGEIGDNPFLPLLITTPKAEGRVVLAALLAGVDDVLTKPLSPAAVAQRMLRLAAARKPFVAASGYMGPIRAQMGRAFRDVCQFEAPNALKAALAGESLEDLMSDPAFEQARDRLTILRLECCTRLVAAAARGMLHAEGDEERRDAVADIRQKALELRDLAPDIPEGNLHDTVRRLAALADVAAEEDDEAARATRLVSEIADMISTITERQGEDLFAFPADIIRRMDSRFPGLLESA